MQNIPQSSAHRFACRVGASCVLLLLPFAASAQSQYLDRARNIADTSSIPTGYSIATLVGQFIAGALALLGVILVVLIIYAGYLYLTAAGDDDKVVQAKTLIRNAIIGLIITMSAYAITNFVLDRVTGSTTQKAAQTGGAPAPGCTKTGGDGVTLVPC